MTLIGGGEVSKSDFDWSFGQAPVVVAADGGANFARIVNVQPHAVIGDLDSIDPDNLASLPSDQVHHIAEQDSTDFDKCLRSIDAPLVIGLGFLGFRLDHQLAALSTLVAHPEVSCLLIGSHDVAFLAPLQMTLTLPIATRLSLYPMGAVSGHAQGLAYPLDDICFAPDGRIGTSNQTTEETVQLTFSDRKMVVILPRDQAQAALNGMRGVRAG
ncbi:thiamine diphosphokinase [Actibacterium mucosum]|uniref:thiamine diphosphokinase n=1 Tax=Actibacterium mucosum TaxID=1087332 RepID=UPI001F020FD0|nr:thiamine diphosphokinase [Actibacterium mucosum]